MHDVLVKQWACFPYAALCNRGLCIYASIFEMNLAHMHPQHRSGSRIMPLLLDFLESSIFCHIKDVWLTWMCCRGTETNIIHREKKRRLWAQEIKRCERGSFRANRKRIAVVCDFLLIRGFWRLFQALCHLPVSLTTALLETRWSLGIHRLAFVRGLRHAADAGSRSAHAVRWITWSSHLVLTSAYSLESDTYLDQTHRRSAIHFMVGFGGVEEFGCWCD